MDLAKGTKWFMIMQIKSVLQCTNIVDSNPVEGKKRNVCKNSYSNTVRLKVKKFV